MVWLNVPENIKDYHGFIYKITHEPTGVYYIGRCGFWRIEKKKPLKGRVNKRHVKKETKWRDYYGSSEKFKQFVEEQGEEQFRREMIYWCKNKWEEAYHEARLQIENEVLFDEKSMNGIINLRIPRPPKESVDKYLEDKGKC